MKLTVNGQLHEVMSATLDALLAEFDYEGCWLATAVNNSVVHAADRSVCRLQDGDRIEVLAPMQGG